jgi:hypothetical protein
MAGTRRHPCNRTRMQVGRCVLGGADGLVVTRSHNLLRHNLWASLEPFYTVVSHRNRRRAIRRTKQAPRRLYESYRAFALGVNSPRCAPRRSSWRIAPGKVSPMSEEYGHEDHLRHARRGFARIAQDMSPLTLPDGASPEVTTDVEDLRVQDQRPSARSARCTAAWAS